MNLIKINPFASGSQHNNFGSFVDDFFNTSIADFVGSDFVTSQPSINVIESANDFKIELAVPGLEKSGFEISVEKNQLTIFSKKPVHFSGGEKKTEEKKEKFTRREFNYSSFSRTFTLSDKVDATAIDAKYVNGLLEVTVPKKEEAKEQAPINIEIK